MKTSRRDFIANASAAAAATHDLAHAQESEHEHDHSVVPSDPALRVKSLESLLVEKGSAGPSPEEFGAIRDTRRGTATNYHKNLMSPSLLTRAPQTSLSLYMSYKIYYVT
jgi:hypothetical protein